VAQIKKKFKKYLILLLNLVQHINFETSWLDFLSSLKLKLNYIKIIMTWLSRVEGSKDNLDNRQKALIDFKKIKMNFFLILRRKDIG